MMRRDDVCEKEKEGEGRGEGHHVRRGTQSNIIFGPIE